MEADKRTQKTKNQHFVPKCYLRGFARLDDENAVYVYDFRESRQFSSPIANIATRRYFHDFAPQFIGSGDDPQFVEHFLANEVEGPFAYFLKFIAATVEDTGITPQLRQALAFYLIFQAFRTADFRERFDVLFRAGSETIKQRVQGAGITTEIPDLSAVDSYTPEHASLWHASLLGNVPDVLERSRPLTSHVMYICVNDTDTPFWTSDDPVVATTHAPEESSTGGLEAIGTEVIYPLTKRLALKMWEPTYLRKHHPEMAAQDGTCIRVDSKQVKYNNAQQVVQCARQVYSPTPDFSLLDEIEAKNPGALSKRAITLDDLLPE